MQVPKRVLLLQLFILCSCIFTVVEFNLLKDELLILWDLETEQLEVKVEVLHRLPSGLIVLKMQSFHIGVG